MTAVLAITFACYCLAEAIFHFVPYLPVNISGRGLTSFLSASDSPLFCVVGPPSLRCLSIIKYGRNNVQSPKKNKIHVIRYHLHPIPNESNMMKIMLKKKMFVRACRYTASLSIRQQNSQSQPLRKKKKTGYKRTIRE